VQIPPDPDRFNATLRPLLSGAQLPPCTGGCIRTTVPGGRAPPVSTDRGPGWLLTPGHHRHATHAKIDVIDPGQGHGGCLDM
jgi:hypothetical protein